MSVFPGGGLGALPGESQASRTLLCPYMSVDAVQSWAMCAAVPATVAWALPAGQEQGCGSGEPPLQQGWHREGFWPRGPQTPCCFFPEGCTWGTPPLAHHPALTLRNPCLPRCGVAGAVWAAPHTSGGPGPSPGPLCAGDSKSLRGKEGAPLSPLPYCPTTPSGGDPKPHCRERPLPAIASPGDCMAWGAKGRGRLPPAQPRGISSRCLPAGGNPSIGRPVCSRLRSSSTIPQSLHYFSVNRAFPSQSHQHFCVAPHLALIGPGLLGWMLEP